MPAKSLKSAVFAQLCGTKAEKIETLRNVAANGADKGTSGFIWTAETRAFARRNRKLIIERLREDADNFGVKTIVEMICGFNTMKYEKPVDVERAWGKYLSGRKDDNDDALCHLENTLAWYSLEEIAHAEEVDRCVPVKDDAA